MTHHDLFVFFVFLCIIVGASMVSHVADKFDLLAGPLGALGFETPFWPTFAILVVISTALAWPEIQDSYDTGHLVYVTAKIETLQDDGLRDLFTSTTSSTTSSDQCKREQAQWELNEAQAEALEELHEDDQAKQVRASQTLGPQCTVPSTPSP